MNVSVRLIHLFFSLFFYKFGHTLEWIYFRSCMDGSFLRGLFFKKNVSKLRWFFWQAQHFFQQQRLSCLKSSGSYEMHMIFASTVGRKILINFVSFWQEQDLVQKATSFAYLNKRF